MRKLIMFFTLLFFTVLSNAQSDRVYEKKETMKAGTFDALVVDLPNTDEKVAARVWKSYIRGYGSKAKRVRKSKEVLSKDVIIAGINKSDPIEVFAKVVETNDGSELIAWFSMGEFFVSSGSFPSDYTAAQNFLNDYAHEVAKELVVIELEGEEKKFKKMEKEMKKLKKKNDGYHKDIERAKEAIAKAEKNIEENEREQKEQVSVMDEQSKVIQAIKDKLSEMQ